MEDTNGDGVSDIESTFAYGVGGLLREIINTSIAIGAVASRTLFEYDGVGRLIRRIDDFDGDGNADAIRVTGWDHLMPIFQTYDRDGDGDVESAQFYYYDRRYLPARVRSVHRDSSGTEITDFEDVFEYDSDGRLTRAFTTQGGATETETHWSYDQEGRLGRVRTRTASFSITRALIYQHCGN
ncbi:MAG: hypothetical protein IPJ58_19160 [Ardenticatenia bacterium]|nr:hypothetical protein [Ardenticatenia bacterium]